MLNYLIAKDLAKKMSAPNVNTVEPKYGEEIFGDGPYPHSFDDFVGQDLAKMQLMTAVNSARLRQKRMDHTLLASGTPGIGKTSLAKLAAFNLGHVGYVELSGTVTEKDAKNALEAMHDNDVLCIDEIHRLVQSGKKHAEWLLHLMQDGVLMTAHGPEKVPNVTIIGTTTDAQRLPSPILQRFMVKPQLVAYTPAQAVQIAKGSAHRMGFGVPSLPMPKSDGWLHQLSAVSNYNPRIMQSLLITIRDIALTSERANLLENGYDIKTPMQWHGRTYDGLDQTQADYLISLISHQGTCSMGTLKALLGESILTETESELINRGLVTVTGQGRTLTHLGLERARELLKEVTE